MSVGLRALLWPALLSGGLFAVVPPGLLFAGSGPARGVRTVSRRARQSGPTDVDAKTQQGQTEDVDAKTQQGETEAAEELPTIDVLAGLRGGQLAADAEGMGDGRMTLNLTNRTNRKLRVVLPPGLIASGVTGQFGGMGGMMGGMGGGMGGMGGGMMGGGMGGMGGGMMGGMGRGGMGGGMMGGRGMRGGGTMPASMGMMMLGRLIMTLIGDRDSWDQRSLMMGMMGGMGMGGMGGMGGGMGGMGGGMMGGMGGGFRSVPPTSLPETTLKPKQTRHLPTALVSLGSPADGARVLFPAKGEKLKVGDISQVSQDSRINAALKRLAADKAPQTVSQLVMWNVAAGMDWSSVERLSARWANAHEVALARQFVEQLGDTNEEATAAGADSGVLHVDVTAEGSDAEDLARTLRTQLKSVTILGLKVESGVPARPPGPALALRVTIDQTKVVVHGAASDSHGAAWVPLGSYTMKRADAEADGKTLEQKAARVADSLAAALLDRLVRCTLSRGPRVKGKETFKIRIVNGSPLILNGLALTGPEDADASMPTALAGFCLPPRKSSTVPVSSDSVERLNLKEGIRVLAADLSGL